MRSHPTNEEDILNANGKGGSDAQDDDENMEDEDGCRSTISGKN